MGSETPAYQQLLRLATKDHSDRLLARIIHECRGESFETELRQGFSHVRPTEASWQSVEEVERETPTGRVDRTMEQIFMNSPG